VKRKIFAKKMLCALMSLVIMASTGTVAVYASDTGIDYVITNPYAGVNWKTWKAYKTQLHCHTIASDGALTVKQVVQKCYDLGYGILAITDHGTNNRGWNKQPQLVPLVRFVKRDRTHMAPIVPLTDKEYKSYINGTAATTNGTVRKYGILDVPLGIELNMATPKADCHLTGYFADYGQGLAGVFGDYETPSKNVAKLGGISMLAHVGEFVYLNKDWDKHLGQPVDDYYANKFAKIFLDNPGSSVGMGINSAEDEHTCCDRILYDQILQKTIPNGVVPWGFTFADAHTDSDYDRAYTMQLMPVLSLDAFKTSMVKGTFFSVSRFSSGVELNGMSEMPKGYKVNNSLKTPMVTGVTVNQKNDTISVKGTDFNQITWVSNGNVIARGMNYTTLKLDSKTLLNKVGMYVRFYITGPGGICYSQPFVIHVQGKTLDKVNVPATHDLSTFLRGLVTVVDALFFKLNPAVWAFKYFALGYSPFR